MRFGGPVLLNFWALSIFSKGCTCFSCLFGNQALLLIIFFITFVIAFNIFFLFQEEIIRLQEKIDSYKGKPMNLTEILTPSVSNIMVSMLSAKEDPTGQRRALIDSILKILPLYFRPTRIHAFFPWLRRWMVALKIWGYDRVDEMMKTMSKFLQ